VSAMTSTHQDAIRATAWRQSLRQHCDVAALDHSIRKAPHWLLKSVCGRKLLVDKLRETRPGLGYSIWTAQSVIDPLLDAMVDQLEMRMMPEPKSLRDQLRLQRWTFSRVASRSSCGARGVATFVPGDQA